MSFFSRYAAYIQNNPQHYWFKRKAFGWGWVPATWEGWATLLIWLLVFALLNIDFMQNPAPDNATTTRFLFHVFVLTLVLIAVCYWKGEKPGWRWGIPEDKSKFDG